MAISRKLFRLFKFFNEYATIQKTLKGDAAPADKYLAVLTRLAFFFYWVFDNLGVLVKVKFIKSLELAPTVRRANSFWLLGLILTIIGGIRSLLKLAVEGKELKLKSKEMDETSYKEKAAKIKATRTTAILTLIKAFGDTTTAS
jgi:hypothetical protein